MVQFKTDRIKDEYSQLHESNNRLWQLIYTLSQFTELEFNKDVVLTCIYRTEEENNALYAETPPEKRPPTSPHCSWKAVDLRSTIYTDTEITRMLEFLNCFRYQGGQRKVAIYHLINGNTWHMHIQYS